MKAAVVGENGLEIRDVPEPAPGPDEVKVRVRACGLNRADLIVLSGHKHGAVGGPGAIVGLEFAGEVAAIGANVTGVALGDRVMCTGSKAFAEFAVTDRGRVHTIPANTMSFAQAATLPIALQTMHDAIVTNGRLRKGESILIQGASSGVGLMGLQIAKLMGAGLVIGTSRDASRRARLKDFGADLALDTSDPTWPEQAQKATGGKGIDVIIDQVSAGVANQTLAAAAIKGRIVNVGRLGGFKGEYDFDTHALKRIAYIGVTFRTRSVDEVREINRVMRADLWPAVEAGTLALPLDKTFPFAKAAEALAYTKANNHLGKVVLEM
jgi:NADPH2:quinone reductase